MLEPQLVEQGTLLANARLTQAQLRVSEDNFKLALEIVELEMMNCRYDWALQIFCSPPTPTEFPSSADSELLAASRCRNFALAKELMTATRQVEAKNPEKLHNHHLIQVKKALKCQRDRNNDLERRSAMLEPQLAGQETGERAPDAGSATRVRGKVQAALGGRGAGGDEPPI